MSGVVSVGAAVGAAAFAATDIVAAGTLTVMGALEATAALGAGLSAVGAITHNKGLQIAGMGLGLVGGVGALATSAGVFGAEAGSTALFGSSAGDVTAGAAAGAGAGGAFTGAEGASMAGAAGLDVGGVSPLAGTMAGSPGGVTDIIDSIANPAGAANVTPAAAATSPDVTPPAAVDNVPQGGGEGGSLGTTNNAAAPQPGGSGLVNEGSATPPQMNALGLPPDALTAPAAPAAPSGAPATSAPTVPRNPAISGTQVTGDTGVPSTPTGLIQQGAAGDAGIPGSDAAARAAATAGGTVPTTGTPSMFDNLLKFAGTSGGGHLLGGVIQAGAAFISGATSTLTPAQVAALQAQANANQAAANISNRQLANMGEPIPVATRTQAPPGLINNRLPPPNAVTGVPT